MIPQTVPCFEFSVFMAISVLTPANQQPMTLKLCPSISMFPLDVRRLILRQITVLRSFLRRFWNRILACTLARSPRYRHLPRTAVSSTPSAVAESGDSVCSSSCCGHAAGDSSDLVALKISLLGDCNIGKTSFLRKYAGREKEEKGSRVNGLSQMNKTLCVKGARIAYTLWELGGDETGQNQIPVACKDSVAILFMFDLTSRCTLNSIIRWYNEAKKWNQTAIPVLIGTKFDDFVQLPLDLQWTIVSQARAYARVMKATLFFSSATYSINVNKIFKFITAKLFNLPWTPERNLTIGEPIIDL